MKNSKSKKLKSYYLGFLSEYIALLFLILKGYRLVEHRYKNYFGEIDILVRKKDLLIAVEVKARKGNIVVEEVLSDYQARRIKNAAEHFIAKNKYYQKCGIRFDLIIVKSLFNIRHIKDYW